MANKHYTFKEFVNRTKSDNITDTFNTPREVNEMLISIYKRSEFIERLKNTTHESEVLLLLFDMVDENLDIDSIKDFAFISFQLGKAIPGILKLRLKLQLTQELEKLMSCPK